MIKCPICKRQTKSNEPTGIFTTLVYKNPTNESEGKRIYKSEQVCMKCNSEVLLK